MGRDIVSQKTRRELREYFVGTTLRIIKDEFEAADIQPDEAYLPSVSGQRRSLVERYYSSINWADWSDVRKFITVYESALNALEEHAETGQEWAAKCFRSLCHWIKRDGFEYSRGQLSRKGLHRGLEHIAGAVAALSLPELERQLHRLFESVESDPSLAIGTAKELVETVCKTILTQRSATFADDLDIGQLVKEARKALGLIPEAIPNSAKGAETIRRLLSNLGNVAQGLGELRNLYGTGHGKHGSAPELSPRHARLAVGSAAALATFLLETHEARGI